MLVKLLRLPEKIPCDKRMHFIVGAIFASLLMCVTLNIFIVTLSLVVLAWGIEITQKVFEWGTYDNWDAIAVVIGGLVVILPYVIKG